MDASEDHVFTTIDAWEAAVEERSERLVQRYESVIRATVSTKIDR
jgi:hypothetical protein